VYRALLVIKGIGTMILALLEESLGGGSPPIGPD
jgi:hypothetical protein